MTAIEPRRKRFKIKENYVLEFKGRNPLDQELIGTTIDISTTGCMVKIPCGDVELNINDILPNGSITVDSAIWDFGRSTVKYIEEVDKHFIVGLFFIDSMAPVAGLFSKFLQIDFTNNKKLNEMEITTDRKTLLHLMNPTDESVDIFNKTKKLSLYLEDLAQDARWGYWIPRIKSKGINVKLNRLKPDGKKDYILMCSNDYLGMSSHPEVVEATNQANIDYGFGATGSAITNGQTDLHEELEQKLCDLTGKESCLLFNSGYAANIGTISSLVKENDLVLYDMKSHASIVDGIQLSRGIPRVFRHNSDEHLNKVLRRYRDKANGSLIVAEGVFSMSGSKAPIGKIVEAAAKYQSRVYVDEAHSFGLFGKNQLGISDEQNVLDKVDLYMGTFSKSVGTIGGFVCGSKEVIMWLKITARSAFFSVNLPPSTVAATLKSLELIFGDPSHINKLRENISFFRDECISMGFNLRKDHDSSIVPLEISDFEKFKDIYQFILDSGVYVIPVVFPAVELSKSMFRFTVSSIHSQEHLALAVLVIKQALEKYDYHPKRSD